MNPCLKCEHIRESWLVCMMYDSSLCLWTIYDMEMWMSILSLLIPAKPVTNAMCAKLGTINIYDQRI